jgi:hypothetical protein
MINKKRTTTFKGNKKLASVGIGTRICHGQDSSSVMLEPIVKLV